MRMTVWGAALLLCAAPVGAEPLFGPDGYRIAAYRAPVARPPDGVGRIAPAAAAALRPGRDALFIDVLPAEGGHRERDGRWRLAEQHESVPGAHWFPEAGRGVPEPGIAAWFAGGRAAADGWTAGSHAPGLLPGRLLDELERRAAAARHGLSQCLVAGGGDGRLARPGTAIGAGGAGGRRRARERSVLDQAQVVPRFCRGMPWSAQALGPMAHCEDPPRCAIFCPSMFAWEREP